MTANSRRKFFDAKNNRLFYLDRVANKDFWDEKWEVEAQKTFANPPRHRATVRLTLRYLQAGARVLEGGCGLGDLVNALHNAGFKAEGIDYAPKIVAAIQQHWPHLSIREGDVHHLPVADGYYDGYWSIGVIEHFPHGYEAIGVEMRRVLRQGGYLFVSFPSLNPFRQAQARARRYPTTTEPVQTMADFFQFALDPGQVQAEFTALGFELVGQQGMGTLQGLAEDLSVMAAVERVLSRFPRRVSTVLSMSLDILLGRYAGHSCLFVMRKK